MFNFLTGSSAINDLDPMTKDDFDALRKRIMNDLLPFEKRPPYQDFVEDLIQDLALACKYKFISYFTSS